MTKQLTHEIAETSKLPRFLRSRRNKAVERVLSECGLRVEKPSYVFHDMERDAQATGSTIYRTKNGDFKPFYGSLEIDLNNAAVPRLDREDLIVAADFSSREDAAVLLYDGCRRVMTRKEE